MSNKPDPQMVREVTQMLAHLLGRGMTSTIVTIAKTGDTFTMTAGKTDRELSSLGHVALRFIEQCAKEQKDVKLGLAAKEAYAAFSRYYPPLVSGS